MLLIEAPRFINQKEDSFWTTNINKYNRFKTFVQTKMPEIYNIKVATRYQFNHSKYYRHHKNKINNETTLIAPSKILTSRIKQRCLKLSRKKFKNL